MNPQQQQSHQTLNTMSEQPAHASRNVFSSKLRPGIFPDYPSYTSGSSNDDIFFASTEQAVAKPKRSQKRVFVALAAFVGALGLCVAILIPTAILLIYIYVWHSAESKGSYTLTGANPTRLVAITTLVTKATEQSTVPAMGILATYVAAKWWMSGKHINASNGQAPTGIQLGIAMSVLSSANVFSAKHALQLLLKRANKSLHGKIKTPRYIKSAIFVLIWLLTLHYAIATLDYVLHWTTSEASVIEKSSFEFDWASFIQGQKNISQSITKAKTLSPELTMLSRPFNLTLCEQERLENPDMSDFVERIKSQSCGLVNGGNNIAYINTPERLRTLSNSSSTYGVAWADDGTAIATSGKVTNFSFTAKTMGVKAQCKSITSECVKCLFDPVYQTQYCYGEQSSEAHFGFDCPNLNTTASDLSRSYVEGIIDPDTNWEMDRPYVDFLTNLAPSNPFRFAFVAQSMAYAGLFNATSRSLVGDTGFFVSGHQGGLNVLDCSVEVMHVTYQHVPPSTYTILSSESAPLNETRLVSYDAPLSDAITVQIQGFGTTNKTLSFAEGAGLQLAKQMLASAVVLYDVAPAMSIDGFPVNGAKFLSSVLFAFVAFVLCYAVTLLIVGVYAAHAAILASDPAQTVAKARLLNSYGALADAYGRGTMKSEDALETDCFKIFADQDECDRLVMRTILNNGVLRIRPVRQG